MKTKTIIFFLILSLNSFSLFAQKTDPFKPDFSSPAGIKGMSLVWNDEFNISGNILLNLALGGNGGDPSKSIFPIKYEVDYVRVYQKK